MDPRVRPLAAIFELNGDLLSNCLEGLTDDLAGRRMPGGGNSIAVLAGHLTESRCYLAGLLGADVANPLAAIADAGSIDEIERVPPLDEIRAAFDAVTMELGRVFAGMRPEAVVAPVGQSFPIPGGTALDAIAFLAQHDTYHLGQIAFLRRRLGLPAMRYERRGAGAPADAGPEA